VNKPALAPSCIATGTSSSASSTSSSTSEPIRKEVESVESVVIPCVAPESGRGASCGSRNIERRRTVVA
jgi:hypothetical protein